MKAPDPAVDDYAILIIAKAPVPGRVKTRLQPPFTPEEAALLAEAALRDTLDAAAGAAWLGVALDLCGLPATPEWIIGEAFPQSAGTLGDRLDAAFAHARTRTSLPILLLGMDTPQVTKADLLATLTPLEVADFSLGLAADGGFWTLAARGDVPPVFRGIPMSQADTGELTRAELANHGTVAFAPVLEDVDDAASAARVAQRQPDSRFARLHQRLTTGG